MRTMGAPEALKGLGLGWSEPDRSLAIPEAGSVVDFFGGGERKGDMFFSRSLLPDSYALAVAVAVATIFTFFRQSFF